ncbi:MAG: two-component regulator propeller domain-containing protein [Bacteroidota bacterium]
MPFAIRPFIAILVVVSLLTVLTRQEAISQSLGQWYRVPSPGDVQKVFITSDSTLFACTTTGLYKENLRTGDWKFYSSADGFIGNNVYSITRDLAGNLYFASSPIAVFRSDSFGSFPLDSVPEAADVLVDKKGWLWCAAWNSVYEDGSAGWNQFTNGIGEGNHLVLALDSIGNVWCGGGDSDISYHDSLGWHLEQFFEQGISGTVSALTVASDGTVWAGTSGCNLGHRLNGTWLLSGKTPFPWYLTGIAVSNDTVWVAARSLFRGVGSSWMQFTVSDGLADNNPISATFDRWGQLWIGHPGGRLSVLRDRAWYVKTLKSALPDFHASSVAISSGGLMCVGTENGGVALFDGVSWQTVQSGLPSDTVSVVRFDNAGNLWVGTPNGITMYNGSTWRRFTTADGLLSNIITSVVVSNKDSVWCSTGTSIARFNGNSWNSFSIPANVGVETLRDLAVDSAGTIWAASDSGIVRFDGGTFQHFYPIVKHSGINSIAVDRHGIKWCGSDSAGAWQFNDSTWTPLDWRDVGSQPVTSVRIGPNGDIWFGASNEGGMYQFDGSTWNHFSETGGLAGGDVHDVAFDKHGNVWMASELGVSAYNKSGVVLSVPSSSISQLPTNFELKQNFPNPFNPTTRIEYTIAGKSYVEIFVYNILGQAVRKLIQQWQEPGSYAIDFGGTNLSSGVYFYRMSVSGQAGTFARTRKMVLLR